MSTEKAGIGDQDIRARVKAFSCCVVKSKRGQGFYDSRIQVLNNR